MQLIYLLTCYTRTRQIEGHMLMIQNCLNSTLELTGLVATNIKPPWTCI